MEDKPILSQTALDFLSSRMELQQLSYGDQIKLYRELIELRWKDETDNFEYHLYLLMRNINTLTIDRSFPTTIAANLNLMKEWIIKIVNKESEAVEQ